VTGGDNAENVNGYSVIPGTGGRGAALSAAPLALWATPDTARS
jgi:hypothetical protein